MEKKNVAAPPKTDEVKKLITDEVLEKAEKLESLLEPSGTKIRYVNPYFIAGKKVGVEPSEANKDKVFQSSLLGWSQNV